MSRQTRRRKIERIHDGEKPRVLDLFSGCGGLSLGFHKGGFEMVGAVENDPHAIATHALNFYHDKPPDEIARHATARDISKTEPQDLISELKLGRKKSAIDIIVGGPPCQAFARVGRAKLREIHGHPKAFKHDPRGNLYLRFLAYVAELEPIAILIENVPDALNVGSHNAAEEMCEVLDNLGYVCRYTLLNSAFYGVPQMRERMFLIAYTKELDVDVIFPSPTTWTELPVGYEGTRSVALKNLRNGNSTQGYLFDDDSHYIEPPKASSKLRRAVTSREAMSDLPPITSHLNGGLKRGARRLDTLSLYSSNRKVSKYATTLRNWPGFKSREGIYDHVIRSLPRDYPTFRRMKPDDQYPEAHQHALDILNETINSLRKQGKRVGTARRDELKKQIVPPYDVSKFPNKWWKLRADRPSKTLTAHIGKDTYSHIHYDSKQARTISVREAARLQSFPDGFRFACTMNPAFRQIGNAVPPLMAVALAKVIRQAFH